MAPTGQAYNVDWIFSNTSNVHIANNKEWFTSFTPFTTKSSDGLRILGVGEVTLPVKTHRQRKGAESQGTLVLHDVFFAPDCVCNIFGLPILDDYSISIGGSDGGLTDKRTGAPVAVIDHTRLYKLRLKGQSPDQSSLDKDRVYWIRADLPPTEIARWQAHKRQLLRPDSPTRVPISTEIEEYTADEKRWLQVNWGGEFKFLLCYGLSIHDEDERAEGRTLVRSFMQDDVS
ncbi:hypothetical protein P7C71_g5077, partial [Lecanoromycetidae sp. Uapishka_2]